MSAFLELLGKTPTTQGGAVVAWICILSTNFRYVLSHDSMLPNGTLAPHWVPDGTWLTFCAVLAGVSGAHFLAKRMTDTGYVAAKKAPPPAP
jgi:DNA-binding transcriptional regulator PaaX